MHKLLLVRGNKSRGGSVRWSDDDYDVYEGERVIGRIMLHPMSAHHPNGHSCDPRPQRRLAARSGARRSRRGNHCDPGALVSAAIAVERSRNRGTQAA